MSDQISPIMTFIAQQGVPAALILVGLWWAIKEAWPYWKQRDTEERQRHFESDMAGVEARKDTAAAAVSFAKAIDGFAAIIDEKCK